MMPLIRKLWNDDAGFIISAELVLVATIVVIGMIVGLTSVRNQVVQELVDVGQAVGNMSQSYAVAGTAKKDLGWTDGSGYIDKADFCQAQYQSPGTSPGGISVSVWPYDIPTEAPGGEQW